MLRIHRNIDASSLAERAAIRAVAREEAKNAPAPRPEASPAARRLRARNGSTYPEAVS